MIVAWLFSSHKQIINWHVVIWGLLLQVLFATFIFLLPVGGKIFLAINDLVVDVLNCATRGSEFVFGPLAISPGKDGSIGFILAFQALPSIIFFSALISLLYYWRVMPFLISLFARFFSKLMKISGAESLAASSNIFVGIESAFTVKPHIKEMTDSELCTMLTACMATVSSNVMALYVFILMDSFPTIAGHLVSASILSAPAAIIMSKLILPETEAPKTLGQTIEPHYDKPDNAFMAVIHGSQDGVKVIVGVAALLIAVLGLTSLVDLILGYIHSRLSLQLLLGFLAYPFTFLLGVAPADAGAMAQLLGKKVLLTEVVAYQDLAKMLQENTFTDPRTPIIATYALCGFTHVASIAIFVGGISSLAPSKTKALTKVAWRSLLAATLACLMTGAVAGVFSSGSSLLFQ